ncbi:MAG: hypothetical protein K2M48_01535 [Clostridiales bacterium]|nr:hypothetical protein [Clostridiales bacterium]
MKAIKKGQIVALALSCALVCGALSAPLTASAEDAEDRYVGGELVSTYAIETVSYTSREVVENIQTPAGIPKYFNTNTNLTNCCGAVAGAIAVGYYDRYYPNMIADWESFIPNFMYTLQDYTYVPQTISSLYSLMKTNVVAEGVSQDEFKSGLTQYIKKQGYISDYTSLGKGTGFNYTAYKNAINNNKVSVLFISPSEIYTVSLQNGKDLISSMSINGKHIMIAYGYYEVKYTIGKTVRTDKYLQVATGYGTVETGYYKVSSKLDAAYIIEVA